MDITEYVKLFDDLWIRNNSSVFFSSPQWSEIQEFDLTDVEDELDRRMENIHSNDCCVLVYTVRINKFIQNECSM